MEKSYKSQRLCTLATEIYIYIMTAVFPLFVGFWGYTRLTDSKFLFFAAVTCAWLLGLLIIQCVLGFVRLRSRLSAVPILIAAFLLVCGVSSLLSPYGAEVILGAGRYDGLVTAALCCCIFFGVRLFSKPKKSYVYALAAAAALNCAVAVVQLCGVNFLGLFPSDYTYYDGGVKYSGEFLSLIGNADLFSAYLCLVLPTSAAVYITSKKRPVLLLPCAALMGFCLFACGVSGGKLAFLLTVLIAVPLLVSDGGRFRRFLELGSLLLAVGALASAFGGSAKNGAVSLSFNASPLFFCLLGASAVLFLCSLREYHTDIGKLRLCLWLSSAGIFAAAIITVYFVDFGSGALSELHNVLHGHVEDGYGSSRILIWRETLDIVGERPLLGGGCGTLAERLDVSFSRYVAETGKTLKTSVDNAHNVYLGMAADTGIVSLLLYLAAMVLTAVSALKRRKSSPMLICLLCGLVCYWVSDFFGLGLFIVSPMMWVLWGLVSTNETNICKPASD